MAARLRNRPLAGAVVLLLITVVLVGVAYAAYHGSDQTPPSGCAASASLLRRTVTDADGARRATATGAASPGSLTALSADGARLTSELQNEQTSDVAYDERVLPLTDAITQAAADARTPRLAADLDHVTSAASAVAAYCGA